MSRKSSENSKKTQEVINKSNFCKLKSNANYTITILENNQIKFIPPYGCIKVDKNNIIIENNEDSKFLTFIN